MIKLQIRYESEIEKIRMFEALKGVNIVKVSKPKRTGKYYRVYLDIE